MAHSNQLREFRLTDHGIELVEVYVGPGGVLTGAARAAQEAQEQVVAQREQQEFARQQRTVERRREALEAQIAALRAQFEAETEEAQRLLSEQAQRVQTARTTQSDMARRRGAAPANPGANGRTASKTRRAAKSEGAKTRGR
jgi:circadian clock protein KaiC